MGVNLPRHRGVNLLRHRGVNYNRHKGVNIIGFSTEELGYDVKNMSSDERSALIASLKNPIQNIYIAAKHLSTLRKIDFASKPTTQLTADDIKVIATRYNRGPDLSLEQIKKNLSYGNSLYNHQTEVNNALNPPARPSIAPAAPPVILFSS